MKPSKTMANVDTKMCEKFLFFLILCNSSRFSVHNVNKYFKNKK